MIYNKLKRAIEISKNDDNSFNYTLKTSIITGH